ncbi:HAD-IA family hydrolase [Vibrio europaeus]|uniref:HAD-IA family hydrolase n=1 Tax=Vibrio europaeus TaxID=300876 RepID=A0AAE7B1U4_9VIBR|nr:HAD-IA family hydrolase [Vibrio europaeus]MDC5804806.1 HAD-IA family hydrolase [Vibrio europaeus]MDC5811888.1 HAD-IA family hydrolase [Vibrio europaeus]MDC5819403.1 HAD-IA family hydrolase [Vibrio europaeus]MDC5827119.1 HAD-IA family hydrolase [Vibrio europaeus]MDC5832485.1 HAD-IA family hydrolase [Vibrio europaeus]
MAKPQAQCVIFDCDGTLVDSERLCCQALCETFNHFGASLSMDEAVSHFEGGKLADILAATKQRLNVNVSIDQLEPVYRQKLDLLFEDQLQPMEGVFEVLDFLNENGVEYCVASNGPRDKIERCLELTGLLPFFKGKIFSAFDTNSWKPEPDLILYSAMNMGFKLEDCIYVDDTPKGLEAGVRAGVQTVHLTGLNNKHHTLDLKKISHLRELEEIL